MSRTEMVAFKQNGEAVLYQEIQNAWRGAMAIWRQLEEKYLPPYRPPYVPAHIPLEKVEAYIGFKPSRFGMGDEEGVREVWNLYERDDVSITDKIVLGTTFDRALVKKEDIPEVIKAFEAFEGETSLGEQVLILTEMLENENVIAVGWNQTSVVQNQWTRVIYNEENDSFLPYNCLTDTKHFWLFDDINKMRSLLAKPKE